MSWGYYGWKPYVPVAKRRANAAREVAKLAKKTGHTALPVGVEGRNIASTFWGKAWCENLEAYRDFENRLPRGRTYVRNGSVVDLQLSRGNVTALVAGSELYKIEIKIKPLSYSLWKSIQAECAGKIDSLIEMLQGKLSSAVMQIVTRRERGLFPTPDEISLDCSCPDSADLCKHVAASLYGVGARLDQNPGLLFLLRGVDPNDLIGKASAAEAVRQTAATTSGAPAMSDSEVADVFGIELQPRSASSGPAPDVPASPTATPTLATAPAPKHETERKLKVPRKLSAAARNRIAAAAKARWAKTKKQQSDKKAA
ncbi:MAG TPA: SWIM zinc finger family protein [Verrucomicrobiae bacterium]